MKPVMRNAKCKMQTRRAAIVTSRARSAVSLHFALLHFALQTLSAQQQPGMPGSMGFTGGIVASNVPPKIRGRDVLAAARRAPAARRAVQGRSGRDVALGEYFGKKARRAGVRVLPVPDAVPAGDERDLLGAEGRAVHAGQGLRRRARQLRSARHAGGGQREEARAPAALGRAARRRTAGTFSPGPSRRFSASRPRRASPISGTRRRSSSRT